MHEKMNGAPEDARPLLQILEDALEVGADAIELEYMDEGLEVSYIYGNVGIGTLLVSRESEQMIVRDIVQNARLEEEDGGKMSVDLF